MQTLAVVYLTYKLNRQESPHQPFKDISVVIGQVTSSNELWDLYGFSHSWAEKKSSFNIITRWQHQHVCSQARSLTVILKESLHVFQKKE